MFLRHILLLTGAACFASQIFDGKAGRSEPLEKLLSDIDLMFTTDLLLFLVQQHFCGHRSSTQCTTIFFFLNSGFGN